MDRKKQIAALTDDEGERLLLAQACERLTRAEQRGIPAATVFLTPREQALLRQLLPQCRFWGGTPDAERAVAYWLPEYEDACSRVNATCSSRRSLHRISSTT